MRASRNTGAHNMLASQWLLWNLQPLGRPLLSLCAAAVFYGHLLPLSVIKYTAGAYAGLKLLSELSALLSSSSPPTPSVWIRRVASDAQGILILIVWLPCALPSLLILGWEVLSLVRLRFGRSGRDPCGVWWCRCGRISLLPRSSW